MKLMRSGSTGTRPGPRVAVKLKSLEGLSNEYFIRRRFSVTTESLNRKPKMNICHAVHDLLIMPKTTLILR